MKVVSVQNSKNRLKRDLVHGVVVYILMPDGGGVGDLLNIFTCNTSLCSKEGLTLETSAYQLFHGGNSTFINSFEKTGYNKMIT